MAKENILRKPAHLKRDYEVLDAVCSLRYAPDKRGGQPYLFYTEYRPMLSSGILVDLIYLFIFGYFEELR